MTADLRVRPLAEEDSAAWYALMCEGTAAYPSAFLLSPKEVAGMGDERRRRALAGGNVFGIVSATDELLGIAALHLRTLDRIRHRAEIGPFYVRAAHQGRGAADTLMNALVERARSAGAEWLDLWVAEGNPRARAFYLRHGFREIGRREDAVRIDGVPETDILMTRHLAPLS
ncbi:GNAT family N-acetyltransferase [Jannaschia marina]|uniref:GNAT family N-acetyltransferase n=1 Tax=Jannaschia marina TaxID=2741674 RepID=UPI0015CEB5EB|nr:GNAT family N-acetyltransferase [Jannaschia marina]